MKKCCYIDFELLYKKKTIKIGLFGNIMIKNVNIDGLVKCYKNGKIISEILIQNDGKEVIVNQYYKMANQQHNTIYNNNKAYYTRFIQSRNKRLFRVWCI